MTILWYKKSWQKNLRIKYIMRISSQLSKEVWIQINSNNIEVQIQIEQLKKKRFIVVDIKFGLLTKNGQCRVLTAIKIWMK